MKIYKIHYTPNGPDDMDAELVEIDTEKEQMLADDMYWDEVLSALNSGEQVPF